MNAAFMLGLGLMVCPADPQVQTKQPDCYVSLAAAQYVNVNAHALASIISAFRREHGLGPVSVDPELNHFAQAHARNMATYNMMGHDVGASFSERRRALRARVVVENVGAAYNNVSEAFASWRDSPGHRANMLDPDMTRMGVGAVPTSDGFYKSFWALVMASPNRR
jgi:uncharacterized protein YkwD